MIGALLKKFRLKMVLTFYDRGVGLLSRLATYHTDRLYGIVPISVAYLEPGMIWDIGEHKPGSNLSYWA